MMKIKLLKNWWMVIEVGILFIFSLVPLLWLSNGVILGHDSGFRLNFLTYYQDLLYSWNKSGNFGSDWSLYHGFLLIQLPETIFMFLTHSFALGQKLTFIYWFFLMGISMYILMSSLFPDKKKWPLRLFASMFYMYNFFLLQGWFIAERAKFSLYAASPLALLILYNVFIRNAPVLKSAILFSLVYFFLNGGGSPPLYGGTMTLLIASFVIFTVFRIRKQGFSGLLFGVKSGVVFLLTALGTNLYWLIPQVGLYRSSYANALGATGGVEGLLSWEKIISKYASYANLFRFQGIPDWYNNPIHQYANAFLTNPILIVASVVPVLVIAFGLLSGKIRNEKSNIKVFLLVVLVIYVIGLFFTSGSHAPFGAIYEYLMRHVPGFAIFRSSFYKFGPVLWFCGAILTGYYFSVFLEGVKKEKTRFVLGCIGILLLVLYHYPYFVSNIFRFHEFFSTRVNVPEYVKTTADFVNTHTSSQDTLLMLPELNPGFYGTLMDTYSWGYFSLDLLPRNSMNRSIVANDHSAGNLINSLYTFLYDDKREAFTTILGKMGIKNILWRDDVRYNEQYKDARKKDVYLANLLSYTPQILHISDDWYVYRIDTNNFTPLISTPTKIELSLDTVDNYGLRLTMDAHDRNIVDRVYSEGVNSIASLSDKIVVEAKCQFCGKNDFEQRVSALPAPHLKYLPDSLVFPYMMKRESQLLENPQLTVPQRIDVQLSRLNTRVSLFAYYDEQADTGNGNQKLSELITEYEQIGNDIKSILPTFEDNEKNEYATRILMFLEAHKKYLLEQQITSDNKSKTADLVNYVQLVISQIRPYAWITEDQNDLRYTFILRDDGIYSLDFANQFGNAKSVRIDDQEVSDIYAIKMQKGFHRLQVIGSHVTEGYAPIVFITNTLAVSLTKTPHVTFREINPTRYVVHIEDATTPFVLAFSQQFSRDWKVYRSSSGVATGRTESQTGVGTNPQATNSFFVGDILNDAKRQPVPEYLHFQVNGFANGWLIDQTGDGYDLIIQYAPQYWFYAGVLMSGIFILLEFAYLMSKKDI